MRRWRHILAMCLTGAMLTTGLPIQSFAMEELSAGPAEEDFSAQEVREEGALLDAGLIETPEESEDTGLVETPAETGDAGLIETPAEEPGDGDLLIEVPADEVGAVDASGEVSVDADLLLSDGEDAASEVTDAEDLLTAGEEDAALVLDGEDTVSGVADNGSLWTFTKSTGLLVLERGDEDSMDYVTRDALPGEYFEQIKHVRIIGFGGIHDSAFYYVPSLKSVYMDDTVISIGSSAFGSCDRLESVRLSENLTRIEVSAFADCPKLERITIPENVEEIGNHVFTDSTALKEVTIVAMECEIADNAIGVMVNENDGVRNTDITIRCYPGSTAQEYAEKFGLQLELIEGDWFRGECGENLQWEVNSSEKRLSIWGSGDIAEYSEVSPPWAYLYEYIQEISIGSGVTSISAHAFSYQQNVSKVNIPDSVTSIGEAAFLNCTGLTEVTLTNKNVAIGEQAFGYQMDYQTNQMVKSDSFVIRGYRGSTAETYAKNNGITFVALNDQDVIEGECGAYLTWRFTKATGKLEILGDGWMPDYDSMHNVIPPWTEIVGAENVKSISLDKGVNSVGAYAFDGMKKVRRLDLSGNIWKIGEYAMSDCTALTTVSFNEDLEEIGNYAFSGCTSLGNLDLPDNLYNIGARAFEDCRSMTKVVIPMGIGYYNARVGDLGMYAFDGCTGLTDVVVKNAQSIPQGCFSYCLSLKNVTFSENTVSIGDYAFQNCNSLEQITLPKYMYYVGECAFRDCPNLKSVTDLCAREPQDRDYLKIFYSGYKVGEQAFGYLYPDTKVSGFTIRGYERSASIAYARANGLNYEIIPYPVSGSCGNNATWNYDTATKTLTIQGTGATIDWESDFISEAEYTYIPNDWFGWNFDAEKIVVEEGITAIGKCTFMLMENVKKVELPNSLREIGEGSFYCLNSLDAIWLPRDIQTISDEAFYYSAPDKVYGYTGTVSEAFANKWGKTFVDRTPYDALEQETIRVTKTQMGPGYISITWNASEYATNYRIYRRVDSGTTKLVKTVRSNVLTYRDTDVEVGKTYRYMVVGALEDTRSQKETKSLKYIQIPKVTAVPSGSSMKISWEKNSSAAGYRLYCKDEATGETTKIATPNASTTTYSQAGLTSGKKYTYTIQAYKGSDVVVYESATELFLKETALSVSNGMTGVSLKWSKVGGASGFNIYRKTSSGSYTKLTNVGKDVVQYIDTSAVSGTTYIYSVVAYSGKTKSSYQNKSILCVKGTTLSLSNGTQGVQAKWTKVPGVKGYYLYRKTSSGSYAKIATLGASATSYVDKTASSGVSYYYAVRPYSGSTQGAYEQKPIRCLATPTATGARTNRVNSVRLTWTKVTGAKGYYIYRKTGTESFTKIATVTSESTLSYVDTNAPSSKTFTYAVRAYNGNTQSGYKAVTVK